MIQQRKNAEVPLPGSIVGTIHTPAGFAAAGRAATVIDFVEIRADCLPPSTSARGASRLSLPYILTARHPEEGGHGELSDADRQDRIAPLLGAAAFLDLELRAVRSMQSTIRAARESGVGLIVSFHDFVSTPAASTLRGVVERAAGAGADVVKIATTLSSASDLARLLALLDMTPRPPLAVMGMGDLGKISRLVLAKAGSVLNYGWLAAPQVPGQWPAKDFRRFLLEL